MFFFQFTSENAILEVIRLKKSCTRLNEPKTILKNNQTFVSHYKKPKHFLKTPCFANSLTNTGFGPPNCTKLLDSLVQAQNRYRKQLNITTILRNTQSLSEKAVLLIIHLEKFVLHSRPQLNKFVQNVQVPSTPKQHWKTIVR